MSKFIRVIWLHWRDGAVIDAGDCVTDPQGNWWPAPNDQPVVRAGDGFQYEMHREVN